MENGEGDKALVTHRSPPVREDCWNEEMTETLVEAWGERFLDLNRGFLRQHDWNKVAETVNLHHGHVSKHRRTDVQCKNRLDTLKKRYKIEKARASSTWRFFPRLDYLLGPSYKPSPAPAPRRRKTPVRPRSKRPAGGGNLYLQWNVSSAVAAAAEDDSSGTSGSASWHRRDGKGAGSPGGIGRADREGQRDGGSARWQGREGGLYGELAEALGRLGEIYERVERERERQTVELEKHRMKFAKDLEIQRMKLFMETQIQMEKIRRANRENNNKRARYDDGEDDDSY